MYVNKNNNCGQASIIHYTGRCVKTYYGLGVCCVIRPLLRTIIEKKITKNNRNNICEKNDNTGLIHSEKSLYIEKSY